MKTSCPFCKSIQSISVILFIASLLVGGCASYDTPAAAATKSIPLADAWPALQPTKVWKNFYDLTQIPRPSHHEEKATAFIASFGRSSGLSTAIDAVGNVIIRKPATKGMERRPGVVLQAHLDMAPQKTSSSTHNFETDPINAFVDNGWVHADGTTLGADNGIGMAIIMTLLQADDVAHGPIEALFTVNEEDGFTGINALATDALQGKYYINVDNEEAGRLVIGSAGAVYGDANATYTEVATPADMTGRQITIDGLLGGHSGMDIGKGRAGAHQLIARLLVNAPAGCGVRLARLTGGDTLNVIPRATTVVVAIPADKTGVFNTYVNDFKAAVASELAATDPGFAVTVASADLPAKVMETGAQQALINAVYAAPQGVYRMSADVPGLVETSNNIGVLSIGNGQFAAGANVRSAIDSERDAEAQRFVRVFQNAGVTVTLYGAYSSWLPNPNSPLLALMKQVYENLYFAVPTVTAVHAGLETSVAGVKYPGMDMISIGPTIQNVHSPDERLEAATVSKVYDLIVATLGKIQ